MLRALQGITKCYELFHNTRKERLGWTCSEAELIAMGATETDRQSLLLHVLGEVGGVGGSRFDYYEPSAMADEMNRNYPYIH